LLSSAIDTLMANNSKINKIDMNSAFKANANWISDYMDDAVHPKEAGYLFMSSLESSCLTSTSNQYCNGN